MAATPEDFAWAEELVLLAEVMDWARTDGHTASLDTILLGKPQHTTKEKLMDVLGILGLLLIVLGILGLVGVVPLGLIGSIVVIVLGVVLLGSRFRGRV